MRSRCFCFWLANIFVAVVFAGVSVAGVGDSGGIGGGAVVVARCPAGGSPVCARVTNDGAIHLLYDSDGLAWYAVSRDGGKTFNRPICAVDRDSRKPGLEFGGADLAVNNKGQAFVAMSTNAWKLKLPENEWSLQFATLSRGESAFSTVSNLNDKSSERFSLAADDSGNVAAVWLAEKLYANFSRDGGKTFSPNAEISTDVDPCPCCTTSSVFGASGDLAVLYREEAGDNRDMWVIIDHRDGRITRKRISSTLWKIDACPMSCFTISRAGEGYVAAWPTKGRVFFVKLDRDGNQLPPGEVATSGSAIMHEDVLALGGPTGESLIAWKHGGMLNWQLFNAAGRPTGLGGSIEGAGKWAAGVGRADGHFVLFQ